ncbi:MAG: prepilin peptidase [Candidatus Saccharibacteria bacterium]
MIYIVIALLGLCFGSFVNALVYRLHQQSVHTNQSKANKQKYSIATGRSMCVSCHHILGWTDLVPVFSWLWLRGKCRYCHKPISRQYPLVELVTAGLFVASYAYWPSPVSGHGLFDLSIWLVILVGLVALAVYDQKWMILPTRIIEKLVGLALFQIIVDIVIFDQTGGLMPAFYGALVLGGFFWLLHRVSNGKWIGGGDIRLGALLGLIVGGPVNSLMLLFLASLLGSFVSVVLLLRKKATAGSHIPFGPFLIVSAIIVKLFGASLLAWYKHKVLAI